MNTNALIDITPSNCAPKFVSGLVIGTASVPQIPANKWAGIAPTTSSIFNDSKNLVPSKYIKNKKRTMVDKDGNTKQLKYLLMVIG